MQEGLSMEKTIQQQWLDNYVDVFFNHIGDKLKPATERELFERFHGQFEVLIELLARCFLLLSTTEENEEILINEEEIYYTSEDFSENLKYKCLEIYRKISEDPESRAKFESIFKEEF